MDGSTTPVPGMTIAGEAVTTYGTIPVRNPASSTVFAHAPVATHAQLDAAVAAARAAFPGWAATPADLRKAAVRAYGAAIRAEIDTIARLITLEQGKPLAKARSEINGALAFMESFCDLDLAPNIVRDREDQRVEVRRRPLGVIGAITAWNYPVLLALWKIGPALVAGNTVVLKPAPSTPLATLKLGEIGREVLPPGVLNVLNGDRDIGAALVAHPDVRKIAFTGSTDTGKAIMAGAAPTLKRLTLELGGNDAGIVLEDADLDAITPDLFWAKFSNCGQVCAALKRLYVHDSLHDALVEKLSAFAEGVRIGDGLTDGVDIGPIQNAAQRDVLVSMLDDARARGARVAYSGRAPDGPGYWFPISLLTGVPRDAAAVRREAFGPILTIHRFTDPEDALRQANETPFGLGASVWGGNIARATAIAERMDAGTTWVNQHPAMGPDIPFGGIKESGIGVEGARWGLNEYTAVHVLNIKLC